MINVLKDKKKKKEKVNVNVAREEKGLI